jgi:hypothetical protein
LRLRGPSGGAGLEAAQDFYDQGGVATRRRVPLSDVSLTFTIEGDEDQARMAMEALIEDALARDYINEIVYTVRQR